jgi:hypothetical protein
MYVQMSYANPKGHSSFTNNWASLVQSFVQSSVSSGLVNSDPRFKTLVGAADNSLGGGCVIQ